MSFFPGFITLHPSFLSVSCSVLFIARSWLWVAQEIKLIDQPKEMKLFGTKFSFLARRVRGKIQVESSKAGAVLLNDASEGHRLVNTVGVMMNWFYA